VLSGLHNTFEEFNRVRCFNHTLQLSAKALLKPFYSAGLLENNDDVNDDILAAQNTDEDEEGDEGDDELEMDDEDRDEDEDPVSALEDDERDSLIENTEAVRTTLMKVCTLLFFQVFVLISVATIGSQTLLRRCPFDHHCPSCMA
jgi:hypothetical protein